MSLREIARQENISHQAVSEILARALLKLKKALDKKGIKIEDLL
jgi:DNA-directed RNA polymerase specialized sigma24 family protein